MLTMNLPFNCIDASVAVYCLSGCGTFWLSGILAAVAAGLTTSRIGVVHTRLFA